MAVDELPTAFGTIDGGAIARRSVDAQALAFVHSIPTNSLGIEGRHLTTSIAPIELRSIAAHGATAHRPSFHGTGAVAFSTKGEYGVRLMVQLGRHYGSGPASLAEIATEDDLPRAYLEQLAFVLRDAGLVESTRGARGGYTLARPPADIPMSEILRALEGPLAPMICATDEPDSGIACDRTSSCTVNFLWVKVRDAIAGALDGMTLADLVPARHPAAPATTQVPA